MAEHTSTSAGLGKPDTPSIDTVVKEQRAFPSYEELASAISPIPRTRQVRKNKPESDYGSFKDSLRAPVHRWFTYPAGYSYKLVEAKISEYGLGTGATVADPFLGTGTTSLAARMLGVHSIGVEAHSFIHWVAKTKLHLNHDLEHLSECVDLVVADAKRRYGNIDYLEIWPPLIYKCFSDDNLEVLAALREAILELDLEPHVRDFLKLALTATLRIATTAGAGWPYIAPSKYQEKKVTRLALPEFEAQCRLMLSDLQYVRSLDMPYSSHEILLGDARKFDQYAGDESVDLVVTSPPYLNNYDYADRTRLETYFWGIHTSWADISRDVRDHLIIAATTQVTMSSMQAIRECRGIAEVDKQVHQELSNIILRLSDMRTIKNGKKTYDYVVAGYFEDMLQVLSSAFVSLKSGGRFVLVVGDSAPYGVHIPTEEIIGRLAVATGYSSYAVEVLRSRGGKWGHNPQRHKVPLRESILTITK